MRESLHMNDDDKTILERLTRIEQRNARVEADKAWETSVWRIGTIALITYAVAILLMKILDAKDPFLGALIPVFGFILSTQTLPFIKHFWARRRAARRDIKS